VAERYAPRKVMASILAHCEVAPPLSNDHLSGEDSLMTFGELEAIARSIHFVCNPSAVMPVTGSAAISQG
jgi:hypothetical protein